MTAFPTISIQFTSPATVGIGWNNPQQTKLQACIKKIVGLLPQNLLQILKGKGIQEIFLEFTPSFFLPYSRFREPLRLVQQGDQNKPYFYYFLSICCEITEKALTEITIEVVEIIFKNIFPPQKIYTLNVLFSATRSQKDLKNNELAQTTCDLGREWKKNTLEALNLRLFSPSQVVETESIVNFSSVLMGHEWILPQVPPTVSFEPGDQFESRAAQFISLCLLHKIEDLFVKGLPPCHKEAGDWASAPLTYDLSAYMREHLIPFQKQNREKWGKFEATLSRYHKLQLQELKKRLQTAALDHNDLPFFNHPLVKEYVEAIMKNQGIKRIEFYTGLNDTYIAAKEEDFFSIILPSSENHIRFLDFLLMIGNPEIGSLLETREDYDCLELIQRLLDDQDPALAPFKEQLANQIPLI